MAQLGSALHDEILAVGRREATVPTVDTAYRTSEEVASSNLVAPTEAQGWASPNSSALLEQGQLFCRPRVELGRLSAGQ